MQSDDGTTSFLFVFSMQIFLRLFHDCLHYYLLLLLFGIYLIKTFSISSFNFFVPNFQFYMSCLPMLVDTMYHTLALHCNYLTCSEEDWKKLLKGENN